MTLGYVKSKVAAKPWWQKKCLPATFLIKTL